MNNRKVETEKQKIPRVTVLMAVYNGGQFLREAVDSIINQTFTDFEFLIIDDGSTDTSLDILQSYDDSRIRLVMNNENIGLTRALNQGLSLARGEYIARQDADDRSRTTRLQKQVCFLDANPDIVVVGAQIQRIDSNGRSLHGSFSKRPIDPLVFRWYWIFDNPIVHSTAVFRRSIVWDLLGGYNEDFRTSQDCELWSRVGQEHELINLSDVLLDFRVHENSVSKHYKPIDIMKLEPIYAQNIARLLQTEDYPRKFPERWLHVTMPALQKIGNGKDVLQMFYRILERYYFLYPSAEANREIRDYSTFVLTRCARYFATVDRWGSLLFVWAWFRLSKGHLRELFAYAGLFLLGERIFSKVKRLIRVQIRIITLGKRRI